MVQQRRDLFGRIQAGSSGGLHHDARILQNLLFGTLLQLATNDVGSPEEAQYENRNKTEIEKDQKFASPHKASDTGRDLPSHSGFYWGGNRAGPRRRARARSVGLRRRKREPDPLAIILFHPSDREICRILEDEHEQEHDFSTSAFRIN